jgi:hypothetical protein
MSIYMNREHGYIIILLSMSNRIYEYEGQEVFGNFKTHIGFSASDCFNKRFDYIGEL